MMTKKIRKIHTDEFKKEAVKQVTARLRSRLNPTLFGIKAIENTPRCQWTIGVMQDRVDLANVW